MAAHNAIDLVRLLKCAIDVDRQRIGDGLQVFFRPRQCSVARIFVEKIIAGDDGEHGKQRQDTPGERVAGQFYKMFLQNGAFDVGRLGFFRSNSD